ncbi:hypothetical protein BDV10DRAFT_157935 [Aspergillus recurvatus]
MVLYRVLWCIYHCQLWFRSTKIYFAWDTNCQLICIPFQHVQLGHKFDWRYYFVLALYILATVRFRSYT